MKQYFFIIFTVCVVTMLSISALKFYNKEERDIFETQPATHLVGQRHFS